ncbi:MAG: hypothetical protein Q4A55_03225 [Aerococcus sp.]|nr:hypothetical protein [Aerococcus sp.]
MKRHHSQAKKASNAEAPTQPALTNRQKMQLQNMRYRRFMMLRYCLAIFFFANITWLLMQLAQSNGLIFLPIILISFNLLALIDMQRKASRPTAQRELRLSWVSYSLLLQAVVDLVWTATVLFVPQWADGWIPIFLMIPAVKVVLIVLLLGLSIYALLGIFKVKRMEKKQDRWYQSVKKFEEQMGG